MIRLLWWVHQCDLLGHDTIVCQEQDYQNDEDVNRVISRALGLKDNKDIETVEIRFE